MLERSGVTLPTQGWKLHVAATPSSAMKVLEALLPLLYEEECHFKFAATKALLVRLNQGHAPRGSAGKFMTIYPGDEAAAVSLAETCDQKTRGLPGPRILSDRAYREGGVVFYRYGSFSGEEVFRPDGILEPVIRDPGGQAVADRRNAGFVLPPWVEDPFVKRFALPPEAIPMVSTPSVVLRGRYRVEGVLRRANKGGVYRAVDQQTGETVIVKEARAHVEIDRNDRDAIDRLRTEAENLRRLEGLAPAPRVRDLFAQRDHLFLVVDAFPGTTLRQYLEERRENVRRPLPAAEVESLICSCAAIIAACHAADLVIADFSPDNLLLIPGGSLRLVDLELACPIGSRRPAAGGTPGYASAEQLRGEPLCPADDYHALGAVAFFIASLHDPRVPPDRPARRGEFAGLVEWLGMLIEDAIVAPPIAEMILGCLTAAPAQRLSPAQVIDRCAAGRTARVAPLALAAPSLPNEEEFREVARSIAVNILEQIEVREGTGPRNRPLEPSNQGSQTDPCSVQHGLAGVGSFLLSLLPWLGGTMAEEKIRGLAAWMIAEIKRQPERSAGLYFGLAGAAWFLLDAGRVLGDGGLVEESCAIANALPLDPGYCDVTHGSAGIGITLLHFYDATGDGAHLARSVQAADLVLAGASPEGDGLVWPRVVNQEERGKEVLYGFAHGNAGIAYFLLAAFGATGERRFLAAAQAAAQPLLGAAEFEGGCAYWPFGPGRSSRWPHWCSGSSGVGTTLLRMFVVTGEERYRVLAEAAARAVVRDRWQRALGQCHGLAGNGEFLLDMMDVLQDSRFHEWALQLARAAFMHRVYRHDRALFPDDAGVAITHDFATGNAGVGAFFHRLASGGERPYMVDQFLAARSSSSPQVRLRIG